jgi:mannose-6-phosphate isomerase-like protein (cupin superfamily)
MGKLGIDIIKIQQQGYTPLVAYEAWRVAVLRYCLDVRVDQLVSMQRHLKTDEVFVLMEGNCVLFSGGDGEHPEEIEWVKMEKNQLYNVKKGVWHTHALDEAGSVLIIENQDTSDENSPTEALRGEQIDAIKKASLSFDISFQKH